jgi:hypothetical protein
MKKFGAVSILTTIFLGLLAWGGSQVIENKTQLARLNESDSTQKELLKEIRSDIKVLLQRRK